MKDYLYHLHEYDEPRPVTDDLPPVIAWIAEDMGAGDLRPNWRAIAGGLAAWVLALALVVLMLAFGGTPR